MPANFIRLCFRIALKMMHRSRIAGLQFTPEHRQMKRVAEFEFAELRQAYPRSLATISEAALALVASSL